MIITVEGRPVNGVDTSQYQEINNFRVRPDWLRFWGIKACDLEKTHLTDPNFATSRSLARDRNIPYRSFYIYLRNSGTAAENVELLWDTVGTLEEGESVYLDWEDVAYSREKFEETVDIMNQIPDFRHRFFTYVNDVNPDMTGWMEDRKAHDVRSYTPLMYPQWNDAGHKAAKEWEAMIWQTGIAREGETMPITRSDCDVNWIMNENELKRVCGYEEWYL